MQQEAFSDMTEKDRTDASIEKCSNDGARKPNGAITVDMVSLKLKLPKRKDGCGDKKDTANEYGDDYDRSGAKTSHGEANMEGSSQEAIKGTSMTYKVVFEEVSQRTRPATCTRQVLTDEQ